MILVENGSAINIDEGNFSLSKSISLDGKKNVIIRGKGMDKTILSFSKQLSGAEGIKITNCENIILEDLTVQDSRILYGLRQEVPVQDVTLLVVRVTSDVDDLHPVKQGRMQVVQTIRRAEEKYLRQVDGHIQKVIGEIVILLGIQDFK